MKRIVISVFAFLLILSVGVVGYVYFEKSCTEVTQAVNEAIRLAEDGSYDRAAEVAQNAEHFWEERKKILSYYVNHGYLYEVDARITGLSQLSAEESKEEFLSCAEQVVQALEYVMSDK